MKYLIIPSLLAVLILGACGGASVLGIPNPLAGERSGFLPDKNFYPELVPLHSRRKMLFTTQEQIKYLGEQRTGVYKQYGMRAVYVNEYTFGGNDRFLSIESILVDGNIGPTGIYYFFYGKKLFGKGKELSGIGSQAVLDTAKEGRNLYFYKGRWFFSLVYSGPKPIPDMTQLAIKIARQVPGKNDKPDGFKYLEVEGVSYKHGMVTWGNALNLDIFPPAYFAMAPEGGHNARVYVISFSKENMAEDAERDFQRYLQLSASDYKRYAKTIGTQSYPFRQAKEKDEGKLVFSRYKRYLVVATRLDDFAAGDLLVERIISRIREKYVK